MRLSEDDGGLRRRDRGRRFRWRCWIVIVGLVPSRREIDRCPALIFWTKVVKKRLRTAVFVAGVPTY